VARVELASVNRKQAEVAVSLPKELAELEPHIRRHVQAAVSRGRVQVSVALEHAGGGNTEVRVDHGLARGLEHAFKTIGSIVGRTVEPQAADFMRQPGLLTIGARRVEPAAAWEAVGPALSAALAEIDVMRRREGEHLREDLERRLEVLERWREKIAEDAPARPKRHRDALFRRLREMGLVANDFADERVTREIALFADRCDISEELTRLASHFAKFREYMAKPEPQGRALDFLCQEIAREFNTIGAKANDAGIAQAVVEAKTELERIREQVQNVE
jgi:uncharacterized protein (TIGR00255 family)